MKRKIGFIVLAILAGGAVFIFTMGSRNGTEETYTTVAVTDGVVTQRAIAIGTLEPEQEIRVKSTISGLVRAVLFKVGDRVIKGQPLFSISPNPTPIEYTEYLRTMEVSEVSLQQAMRERDRTLQMFRQQLISKADLDVMESRYREASLKYQMAKEKFQLLQKGEIDNATQKIDSNIVSPIHGVILSQSASVGDPIVPLTNFQPGTELCAIADLSLMLFKGTVDEIDVGKLGPDMRVEIQVGALPDALVVGRLLRIAPKARKDGNATLFDIEVAIEESGNVLLRAGYSATASVVVAERRDVLVIPERLVHDEEGRRTVEVLDPTSGIISTKTITTGLSDGLTIEVLSGLTKDQQIVERPPREIT